MKNSKSLSTILALDLHPGRFGYAVLEDSRELLDWGVRRNYGGQKPWRITLIRKKLSSLLSQWEPTLVLLNEVPRFSPQIQRIATVIRKEARHRKLPVRVVDKQGVKSAFGLGQQITKYETACLLAEQIPVLHWELPPKRKIWESEHYRMSIFDAAAAAIHFAHSKRMRAAVMRGRNVETL